MDVRVHVVDASRDYTSGLTINDIESVVFNAPGSLVEAEHDIRALLLDLYINDVDVTVKRMSRTDTLVVTFS